MTAAQWLEQARGRLLISGSPDPQPDAEWILLWAMNISRVQLRLRAAEPILGETLEKAQRALERRVAGEPLQYVLGEAWFYGRRFRCDRRALIPRQDTETLCEAAILRILPGRRRVLDLCTGSGIIGVTIALERPMSAVTATDISQQALSLAMENAQENGARIDFRCGDLFEPVAGEKFDAILSNPPYLTGEEMKKMQRELHAEPQNALFGGEDGLEFYRRIAAQAPEHLLPGGVVLLEIGSAQAQDVQAMFKESMPGAQTGVLKDMQGLDRVVWAR